LSNSIAKHKTVRIYGYKRVVNIMKEHTTIDIRIRVRALTYGKTIDEMERPVSNLIYNKYRQLLKESKKEIAGAPDE